MAQHIEPDHLEELEALGRALFEHALVLAPRYTLLEADADPMANEVATRIQAMVMAISGLLTAAGQPEGVTLVALGAGAGAALGMCQGDRRVLYHGFREQFSRSLAEVAQAMEPQGHA